MTVCRFVWGLLAVGIVTATFPVPMARAQSDAPETDDEKAFYALGLELANGVRVFRMSERELQMVQAGLRDGTLKKADGTPVKEPVLDWRQHVGHLESLAKARKATEATAPAKPKAPLIDAERFIADALKEKGARKLSSGVIIKKTKKVKSGRFPERKDMVIVHYRGTLLDGTEFDSSYKRMEPTTFGLDSVIPCWTNGVGVMKIGEKARLICPPDTAYGKSGIPPDIPPNSTLVFDVELLGVK
jgi:FKBP-type peptidyl-prolyl cis-trans isomerase